MNRFFVKQKLYAQLQMVETLCFKGDSLIGLVTSVLPMVLTAMALRHVLVAAVLDQEMKALQCF